MQTYEISVDHRSLRATSEDTTLVRTSQGVDRVRFSFTDPEWEGFDLNAVFSNGQTVEVPLSVADGVAEVEVPDAVLESNGRIGVTVHGYDQAGNHIVTEAAWPLSVMQEGDPESWPPPGIRATRTSVSGHISTRALTGSSYSVVWQTDEDVGNIASSGQGIMVDPGSGARVKVTVRGYDQSSQSQVAVGRCPADTRIEDITSAMYTLSNGSYTVEPTHEEPMVFAKVRSTRDGFTLDVKFEIV